MANLFVTHPPSLPGTISPAREKGEGFGIGDTPTPVGPQGVADFITPATLASFPGASFVVGLILHFARLFGWVGDGKGAWGVALGVALLLSLLIFWVSVSDPQAANRPKRPADWTMATVIALLNALVLASAAIGGTQAMSAGPPAAPAVARPANP